MKKMSKKKAILVSFLVLILSGFMITNIVFFVKNNLTKKTQKNNLKNFQYQIAQSRIAFQEIKKNGNFLCNCNILVSEHYGYQHSKSQQNLIDRVLRKALAGEKLADWEDQLLLSLRKVKKYEN